MPTAIDAPVEGAKLIEFIKKGQITIPKKVRQDYNIVPGQKGMLIELAGGFLILPVQSEIPSALSEIRHELNTDDMSLAEMLKELRSIREAADYEEKA